MLKVVTRKLREPPDLRYVVNDDSSDHEYSLGEYYKTENPPLVWRLDEYIPVTSKRPIEEFESPEYYSTIKKPFIESEGGTFSDIYGDSEEITIEEFDAAKACFDHETGQLEVPSREIDPLKLNFEHYNNRLESDHIYEDDTQSGESCSSLRADVDNRSNSTDGSVQEWLKIPAQKDADRILKQSPSSSNNDDDDDDDDNYELEIVSVVERRDSDSLGVVEIIPATENPPKTSVKRNRSVRDFDAESRTRTLRSLRRGTDKRDDKSVPVASQLKGIVRVKKWLGNSSANISGRDSNETIKSRVVRSRAREQSSPESPVETLYYDARRVTRSCVRGNEGGNSSGNGRYQVGKVVWGYCKGWWPAIIVSGEDVGLEPIEDKVCVYWIAEDLISMLNEKTKIEPFFSNLETRLLRHLEDKEVGKDRRKASFVTLKLFSKYLKTPLIKPWIAWAEKHLMGKSYLNDAIFYPFPKNMQQRLDQFKKKNKKLAESEARAKEKARTSKSSSNDLSSSRDKYRDNLDKGPKENGKKSDKFPKNLVKKSSNYLLVNSEPHCMLPLKDQKPGVIVWGKIIGHSWWPAMIIHHHDCGTKEPNFGCQWILWYGDYRLSQVHHQNVMKFDEGIRKLQSYITECKREIYMNAVLKACEDYCARLNYNTSNWSMDDVLSWVSSLGNNLKTVAIPRPNDGRLESRYSIHIAMKLNEIKANQEVAAERESKIKNCDPLKAIFTGLTSTLKKLCIGCLTICHDKIQDHPFFECVLCKDCMEEFKAAIFAYGEDGKCFYCTLCAGSDTIVMCDSFDCPRVYCTACLKYLISPTEYEEILIKDPWLCFLCVDSQSANKDPLFKPRLDWKTRIGQLYNTNLDESWNNVWESNRQKKKIRVLSLFDGISTGLLALEKLGMIVEKYYASEIDVDAKHVSSVYFGNDITQLGDVRDITEDTIARIAPIDLLIGGSPCNDLSLANPNRLGLNDPNGTGVLFFDYCRIKELVTKANKGHHLFWLFENVASMPSRYRLAINESLRQEPSLIDASDFSPQHRPRLFWSNLPIGISFPLPDSSQDLQSVLIPNCDRHALVKKIQTVTTKVNSLKQGVSLLKPVLMEGKPDSLWITELEAIFGLPKHFTDVKNLSATKRQKLIGQSWSVQTITAILRPLSYFFVTKNEAQVTKTTVP